MEARENVQRREVVRTNRRSQSRHERRRQQSSFHWILLKLRSPDTRPVNRTDEDTT